MPRQNAMENPSGMSDDDWKAFYASHFEEVLFLNNGGDLDDDLRLLGVAEEPISLPEGQRSAAAVATAAGAATSIVAHVTSAIAVVAAVAVAKEAFVQSDNLRLIILTSIQMHRKGAPYRFTLIAQ